MTRNLSRVHTSNDVEATLSNATSQRFFRQSRSKLNMYKLFRLCRNDEILFDIVAEPATLLPKSATNVAKNGNNVEATYDCVERTNFYDKLVRHCCRFWQQSRMLFRESRTLLRHCCTCGRGFSYNRGTARPTMSFNIISTAA